MTAPRPLMNAGTVLAGRWCIEDYIGSGELGEVYGVRDVHGTGTFALKLFWPNALDKAESWSAVQQTARIASGLGVEGVARAHDFGIDANSARPFFVTERVSWSSLAARVRAHGPLTAADVAKALSVIARTLDAAHAVGLVHRDLKPENVFVAPQNAHWVRVTDFGVALLRSASPPPPGWGGTPGWVGPDAADPNVPGTPAMDVFALGLVTFFALSGGALHRRARETPIEADKLWQELSTPLDSASLRASELGAALDPAFDAWFQRAVHPSPHARFASVGEMVSAFAELVGTLFAPQSQHAVSLPGVAAAIAQPLIFQPELPRASAATPAAQSPTRAAAAAAAASTQEPRPSDSIPSIAGLPRRSNAPWLIGGAVLCVALVAFAGARMNHPRDQAPRVAAEQVSSAAALPALTPAPSTAVTAPATAASAQPAATTEPALPLATVSPVAVKPLATVKPIATVKPLATVKPVATVKPTATVAATAKAASKPAPVSAPAKKKCGSVFIPCK